MQAHSRVEAYISSPTSPPYVGIQFTALFHTQPLLTSLVSILHWLNSYLNMKVLIFAKDENKQSFLNHC